MNKQTTLLSRAIYYILPVIAIITLIIAIFSTNNIGFYLQEVRGNIGRQLLIVVLFIKPIAFLSKKYLKAEEITLKYCLTVITNIPKTIKNEKKTIKHQIKYLAIPFAINCIYSASLYLMNFRRQLGIATFWLLLTHGLLLNIFRIRQGLPLFFNINQTPIRTAILSLIALTIGAITANNYAVKKLKTNRKNIQMVAYLAFFFGAIHTGNTFLLVLYFSIKFIERKDTGTLKIRLNITKTKLNQIKNNSQINGLLSKLKQNKFFKKILQKFA